MGSASYIKSTIDGSYKITSQLADREVERFRTRREFLSKDFRNQNVKRAAEVVNSVSDYERYSSRNRFGYFEIEKILARFRIVIDPQSIEVSLEERGQIGVEIVDGMIGPFDL